MGKAAVCVLAAVAVLAPLASAAAARPLELAPAWGYTGWTVTVSNSSIHCGAAPEVLPTDPGDGSGTGDGSGGPSAPPPSAEGPFTVFWDETAVVDAMTTAAGGMSARFEVPRDARPGTHTVLATCDDIEAGASGTFTLLGSLELSGRPSSGRRGDPVTLSARGFHCLPGESGNPTEPGGPYQVLWGDRPLRSGTAAGTDFDIPLTVPGDAAFRPTDVTVACADHPDVRRTVRFDVRAPARTATPAPSPTTPSPSPSPPGAAPVLSLAPGEAAPGTVVRAVAHGIPQPCTGPRLRLAERDAGIRTVTADAARLAVTFAVPRDTRSGPHTVRLSCETSGAVAAGAGLRLAAAETITVSATLRVTVPDRSSIPASFASPSDPHLDLTKVVIAIVLALLLALAVSASTWLLPPFGFPPEIFNKAVEELRSSAGRLRAVPVGLRVVLFGSAAAVLLTAVDDRSLPPWAHPAETATLLVAFCAAIALTTVTYGWTSGVVLGDRVFRAIPAGLGVAAVCTLLSLAFHFTPGYVYGLVAGYMVADRRGAVRREGPAILLGALATLAVTAIVWLAWGPVDHRVEVEHAGGWWKPLDLGLSVIVLTGIETVLFGLLPIHLLDGAILRAWSRRAWWAVFTPTAAAFGYLMIAETEKVAWSEVVRMAVLFVGFGVVSVLVWVYARRRLESATPSRT